MNNANAPVGHLQTLIAYQAWRRHESDTAEPPVMPHPKAIGEVCEFEHLKAGNWVKALVLARDGDAAWIKLLGNGYETVLNPSDLRPIPTEREKAIEAAQKVAKDAGIFTIFEHRLVAALYDAGWRPQREADA